MSEIQIIPATLYDVEQLQQIGRQTFLETFLGSNTQENMNKYLDEAFALTKLSAELNDTNTAFYFAKLNHTVIGYLKVNFGQSQTELQDKNAIEIERIYVLKEFHGKSVGQQLYSKSIQIAQQKKATYIWLGVWEENLKAISFYKKNGFIAFGSHIFELGNDKQTDIMMKLNLESN